MFKKKKRRRKNIVLFNKDPTQLHVIIKIMRRERESERGDKGKVKKIKES